MMSTEAIGPRLIGRIMRGKLKSITRFCRPVLLCVLVLGSGLPVARASGELERNHARGLAAFYRGDNAAALEIFNAAVSADADDYESLYYLGLSYGRMGDFEGAAKALAEVVAQNADFERARAEYGYSLLQLGRFVECIEVLEKEPGLEPGDRLNLGLAQLRSAAMVDAKTTFALLESAPSAIARQAVFYTAVADYRMGDLDAASKGFDSIVKGRASDSLAAESGRYLELIAGASGGAAVAQPERAQQASPLSLYARLIFEYDSNVNLIPKSRQLQQSLGVNERGDGRTDLSAGINYGITTDNKLSLSLGYEIFQSLHFSITEANIEDHRIHAQVSRNGDVWGFGLAASYDYFLSQTSSLLREAALRPWLSFKEGDRAQTLLYYRARSRQFFPNAARQLEGYNHVIGVQRYQFFGSNDRYVVGGYRWERGDTGAGADRPFAFSGHRVRLGVGWPLTNTIKGSAAYSYKFEDYDSASNGREDKRHEFNMQVRWKMSEHFNLVGGYVAQIIDSNQSAFQYDRHIGSLEVEVR